MTTIQDMFAAIDAAAQDHFEWCTDHDYVNEADPEVQLCRSVFTLDLAGKERDDVSAVCVMLAGSHADERFGFHVPQASIGFNGRPAEFEMASWKLAPVAYAMLAAAARAEGDEARARAFMDAAQAAITEHFSRAETEAEPVYVVAQPARHWSQGPFKYVMGSDPNDGVITWDQYEVEQSLAAGIPQWVVQHAEDGRLQVVGARDSVPVDDETYGEFAEAKTVRDRLNEQARRDAVPVRPRHFVVAEMGMTNDYEVHGIDPRYGDKSVDGVVYGDYAAAYRAALVLDAAKRVFDAAPVPHHHDQTQPHPRAIKDCARNFYGIEATDAEIQAAVKAVMA